jgi:hypothetical protein
VHLSQSAIVFATDVMLRVLQQALAAYQEAHQRNPDNSEVSSKVRTLQKFIKALGKQPDSADTSASRVGKH